MTRDDEPKESRGAAGPGDDPRLEEALAWRLKLDEDHAANGAERIVYSPAYQSWLDDALNRAAMDEVSASWGVLDEHAAAPEVMALRRDALTRARRRAQRRWAPSARWLPAAAAALALIAVGSTAYFMSAPSNVYATAVGERRTVTLDDGSQLLLDSDTRVHVRYSRDARALGLEQGRARFDVERDPSRPFTVTAGGETVIATGTSFNVERLDDKVLVTLLEGHVVVTPLSIDNAENTSEAPSDAVAPRPPVSLNAGQQLVVAAAVPAVISDANLQSAMAWETGTLIFNDELLSEAIARVNRYARKPLVLDPAAHKLRISGVFSSNDLDTFVDALTTYFPLAVSPTNEVIALNLRQ